ncbi:MAG TPA: hypothetical protein VG737_05890 [Cyclobacteriaceae bacterium]|nr:hypothetical protein [Cyclobacteriaceae bacterium]
MKTRNAILLVILAELAVAALGINNYGWNLSGLQATTRFSGRLSLFIFSFIFLLYPNDKPVLAFYFSKKFFLAFAVAHGIHLIELLSYVRLSGTALVPYRVAGGFLAYVIIFLMPVFQSRAETGKLSANRFQSLGMVYLFYVWLIFFMTYVGRLRAELPNAGGTREEYLTLIGWVVTMLGMKIVFTFIRRSKPTIA